MKIYLIMLLVIVLSILSCNTNPPNYEMISEMNTLHPIEIIYFDEKSSDELGDFPISRDHYADLINKIEEDSPKLIILKFFYDNPAEGDSTFQQQLSIYNNIFTQATTIIQPNIPASYQIIKSLSLNEFYIEGYENFDNILLPHSGLLDLFDGIGLVDMITMDQKYKNFPIASQIQGIFLPSLALRVGMYITKTEPIYQDDKLYLGNNVIVVPNGMYRIDLSEPQALYQTHSFIDILNGTTNSDFQNKIIIVFIEDPAVRQIQSDYNSLHNNAEIIADTINTLLKELD